MADRFSTRRRDDPLSLGSSAAEHTPADTDLPGDVKAVVFDAAGTMSYKNTSGGSVITGFPVQAGVLVPFIPLRITAMDGPTKCFLIQ